MNILITGADGFLGKNLIERLVKMPDINIMHFSEGTSTLLLDRNLEECDFLFHFAAVHRPKDSEDFYRVNDDFFESILKKLEECGNNCPVLLTSSIQATDNNDYGRSKLIAENILREHNKKSGARAIIYRLNNIFGKWATPNHHSVVATFCYNINRDLPIVISNRSIMMHFYYIDDVIDSFLSQIKAQPEPDEDGIFRLKEEQIINITLGELADKFYYFRDCQKKGITPQIDSDITKKLWRTYESYGE
jgi:UDP-2-acetamido-2,6-beta-L-arabino-hexul-4-ose reductase